MVVTKVVGDVLDPTESILQVNVLGSDEGKLVGLNDRNKSHVALHPLNLLTMCCYSGFL